MVFLGPEIPIDDAQRQNADRLSGPSPAGRMLLARSSNTMARAFAARSLPVSTTMPSLGLRMQEAASTRSPSISTMQARQLPSARRSEEHTSELQSLMRISYAVFCLK